MDYKSGIISMIEKIEKPGTLEYLYTFIYLFILRKMGLTLWITEKRSLNGLPKSSQKRFYAIFIFFWLISQKDTGGSQMDYKKEIIEMIEKITKTENISMLYGVVKTMVEYEDQKEKKQGSI